MKKRITEQDYIKANRKASREAEIAGHGHPVGHRHHVHKSKKIYDRKNNRAGLKGLPDFFKIFRFYFTKENIKSIPKPIQRSP